ncbi:hypothetical protein E9993_02215 [Labilibacter sediminis]|nr:hypothetical protein E9993_02215 [Labilibacter sediminis]
MKKSKITLLLILVVVVAEMLIISRSKTYNIFNIKKQLESSISHSNQESLSQKLTSFDTLFVNDLNNKLIYFVPPNYDPTKILNELNSIHNSQSFKEIQNNAWIVSNQIIKDNFIHYLSHVYQIKYINLPDFKPNNNTIKDQAFLITISSDLLPDKPSDISKMTEEEIESYLRHFVQLNKI